MATHTLPICHTPLVKGYLRHAYLFSILGTRDNYSPVGFEWELHAAGSRS